MDVIHLFVLFKHRCHVHCLDTNVIRLFILFKHGCYMSIHVICRNPDLAKCGGEAQHLEKLGTWSPPGLPNVQSSTVGPKTPRIGVFLVSLERS
jgi:hypothetical protein